MAFNAAQFRSQFGKGGTNRPASANSFEVIFDSIPAVLQGQLTAKEIDVFNNLRFRVMTADIPTRSFETQERRHSGPQRVVPFGLIYATQQIELIEDQQFTVRSIFDKWQSAVFNQENSYTVAYYDDIVATMTLRVFDRAGVKRKEFKFIETYPVSVQPSQMSWTNNDTVLIVPIELAYREWRLE